MNTDNDHQERDTEPLMRPVEELEEKAHLREDRVEHTYDAGGGVSAPHNVPILDPTSQPVPAPIPLIPESDEENTRYEQDLVDAEGDGL